MMGQRLSGGRFLVGLALLCSILPLAGCRVLMRLPEPRGAHQTAPVDPGSVEGLGPWVEDKDAGRLASVTAVDLRAYAVLVVEPVTLRAPDIAEDDRRVADEISRVLHEKLVMRLGETGVFAQVVDGRTGLAPGSPGNQLRLRGEITRFDVGNRALRWLVGFGAGRTKLQVETRFVDSESGQPVLASADRRVASKGLFGGDSREFLLASADEIARGLGGLLKRLATGTPAR
ncbi:MAG TPA: DUF4410 domain-containing protein [Methylomirabilota bacterium]|nr:DUF4410 domain-containing protein [Methylomirabilota bacterium]